METTKKTTTTKNENLQQKGVKAAIKYLESKGHEIIETDLKNNFKAYMIVSKCDDVLCFTEVKTRADVSKGFGEDNVSESKRAKVEALAAKFLINSDFVDMALRFDVIGLLVIGQYKAMIRHHINAFGTCA